MATICPYYAKCTSCAHHRPDPDRDGQKSCWLAHDQAAAAAGTPVVPEQIAAAAMIFHLTDGTNHTCTDKRHSAIAVNFYMHRRARKLADVKSAEDGFLTDTGSPGDTERGRWWRIPYAAAVYRSSLKKVR